MTAFLVDGCVNSTQLSTLLHLIFALLLHPQAGGSQLNANKAAAAPATEAEDDEDEEEVATASEQSFILS